MTLRSLLVDFNSYFASVEQQVEPRLRGKPLGVVPMLADTTVCIAASVEAKQFGVKTGTKVAEARRVAGWSLGGGHVYSHRNDLAVRTVASAAQASRTTEGPSGKVPSMSASRMPLPRAPDGR